MNEINQFVRNQRVIDSCGGIYTVERVETTALGAEVTVSTGHNYPATRSFLSTALTAHHPESVPLFALIPLDDIDTFVTPEPHYPGQDMVEVANMLTKGYIWARGYSVIETSGLNGFVRIAKLFELTPDQFEDGRLSGWRQIPQFNISRLEDLGL